MNTNCFDFGQTQPDVTMGLMFQSQDVTNGIFSHQDEFLCKICGIQRTECDIREHVVSKPHCNRIKNISANCIMEANKVTCKLCTDYIATDWETFIHHFHEQNHFNNSCEEETKPLNEIAQDLDAPHISYALLIRNQMILLKTEVFFCCGCFKKIIGWKSVLVHIAARIHDEIQKTRVKNDSIDKWSEAECQIIVNNYTFHVEASKFYCNLCHCPISCLQNCLRHIEGIRHSVNIKAKNDDVQSIPPLIEERQIPIARWKTMQDNLITGPTELGIYNCNLCECSLPGWINVSEHVSGKQHQKLLKKGGSQIILPTSSKETSNGSSSSWESTENSSSSRELYNGPSSTHDSSPPSTRSWESSTHSLGYSESSGCLSNSWQTISTSSLVSNQPGATLFHIPQHLTPLISAHMLEKRVNELYCVVCNAHLRNVESLKAHTNTNRHIVALRSHKTEIAQSNTKSAVSAKTKGIPKSDPSRMNNKQLQQLPAMRNATTNSVQENIAPILFQIPQKSLPLISKHRLLHKREEIYCIACAAHLKTEQDLIAHTRSKNHVKKLKIYENTLAKQLGSTIMKGDTALTPHVTKSFTTTVTNRVISETVTTNPTNSPSSLLKVPKWMLSLIKRNSLQHMKDEVYCAVCNSHLQDVPSIVYHTQSSKHLTKLNKFQDKEKCIKNQMTKVHSDLERIKQAFNSGIASNSDISGLSETITNLEITVKKMIAEEVQSEKTAQGTTGETLTNVQSNSNSSKQSSISSNDKSKNSRIKPQKPQKQKATLKKSREFDPRFLTANIEHIYRTNPEKLRIIKLSCQLCFPKTSNELYCLICEDSVDMDVQTFYEHICSTAHTMYLSEAERIDKLFKNHPDQFSDLALAKEFMLESSEKSIQCFACDSVVENNEYILEHLTNDFHNKAKQSLIDAMQKIQQDILVEIESTWYNIQKYWCQPCNVAYNAEFHFAAHLQSEKHQASLTQMGKSRDKIIYDSCIPCAILWLGVTGVYIIHTSDRMHKWLVHTGDYSKCPLPNQTKILLKNSKVEVMNLIKMSNQVLTVEKAKVDILLKCLEDTVRCTYPKAKAYPFGSRVSGLGFPDSDIDVFLDCGSCNGNKTLENYQMEKIKSVERCLSLNEQAWEIDTIVPGSRTPIIKVRHRDTQLRCDISFKNGLSVENTRLIKCFIDNYPSCRKLMLFVKKWLSSWMLSGSQNTISNYAIYWYVIFYLQVKKILPSVGNLIEKQNKSKIIDGWETGICETFEVGSEHKLSFTQLLHGFFEFYSNFDHRYSVACPIVGRAVPKLSFVQLDLLSKEMLPYVNHIKSQTDGSVELFRIDSEMCIQDPYDLSHNLTKAVRKSTLNRFKRLCAASANFLSDFMGF